LTFSLQKYPGEELCMYTLPFIDLLPSKIPRRGVLYVHTFLYSPFLFKITQEKSSVCTHFPLLTFSLQKYPEEEFCM
jgi:hypothetical protein